MKKLSVFFILIICGILITSCDKSTNTIQQDQPVAKPKSLITDPGFQEAIKKAMNDYQAEFGGLKSAEFQPIFFTIPAFGFMDESGTKLVSFGCVPDEDDFLRVNPDGTYSVHITSDDASGGLVDLANFEFYEGTGGGTMVMNYSGPAVEIPYIDPDGNLIFVYLIICPNDVSPASVWRGEGLVKLYGFGPEMTLVAKLTATAKWKKIKKVIELY